MKSILESVIGYAVVKNLEELDQFSNELIRSFIYSFWLLQFSCHDTKNTFNIEALCYELQLMAAEVFTEYTGRPTQLNIVSCALLREFKDTSIDSIERLASITTVGVDIEAMKVTIEELSSVFKHVLGNDYMKIAAMAKTTPYV